MSAAVVVPLDVATVMGKGERAWPWVCVRSHLRTQTPWPVIEAVGPSPWVKADAVRRALPRADAEVLVIHDADVLVMPLMLRAAVHAVETGATWAVPHGAVHRYDAPSTRAFIEGRHDHVVTLARRPYRGLAGGGIVVLRRDVYEDCPLDPRFVGWGGEDEAWGWALETLHGAPRRFEVQLVHLWHPHATGHRNPQRPQRLESNVLHRAYRNARGRPELMRELVDSAISVTPS